MTREEIVKVAYRLGLKTGLLLAWESEPGDSLSCEIDGDERMVDDWLAAVNKGEFDDAAEQKGLGG